MVCVRVCVWAGTKENGSVWEGRGLWRKFGKGSGTLAIEIRKLKMKKVKGF